VPLYSIVTQTAPRETNYPDRRLNNLIILEHEPANRSSEEWKEWYARNIWVTNFTVNFTDLDKAKALAEELKQFLGQPNHLEAERLLAEIKKLEAIPYRDKTPNQRWAHMAYQLPRDVSGGIMQPLFAEEISRRCIGKGMEAMCGWNSNLLPSPDREVIALDYCREALERYPYPDRLRVQCDLNEVEQVEGLGFCLPGSLRYIAISFGFRYLTNPVHTFGVLRELLEPKGSMFFIESPGSGYDDICLRRFSPGLWEETLGEAGFSQLSCEIIAQKSPGMCESVADWYLCEAING
jgi:hypothetical protein